MAQILTVSGVQVQAPDRSSAPAAETFDKLATTFSIDPKVAKHLVAEEGLETIADFCTFFGQDSDVDKLVEKVEGLARKGLNASRLRQALAACRAAGEAGQLRQKQGADDSDLDGLLNEKALNDLRDAFHRRYKLTFGAQVEPSDQLVSRIYKEIERRMCQVHDVFRTKTLTHTFMSSRKKRRIADGVEVLLPEAEGEIADGPVKETLSTYLALLFTLMLAYARAGCQARSDAPTKAEGRGEPSVAYVHVPLDVVLRYHGRAQNRAAQLPAHMALDWVRERDVAERTMWIEQHRATQKTLGVVIQETYERREAQWDLPVFTAQPAPARQLERETPGRASQAGAQEDSRKDKLQPGTWAKKLRDGTELCLKWNQGNCAGGCKRLHACCRVLKSGRVCGMRNHTGAKCKNTPK